LRLRTHRRPSTDGGRRLPIRLIVPINHRANANANANAVTIRRERRDDGGRGLPASVATFARHDHLGDLWSGRGCAPNDGLEKFDGVSDDGAPNKSRHFQPAPRQRAPIPRFGA
jgi:hypothetical protein